MIQIQRREIKDLLEENPSLQSYLTQAIAKAYLAGLDLVCLETPLDYQDLLKPVPTVQNNCWIQIFPETCIPRNRSASKLRSSPAC